ncbi:MAG: hypothetical protein WC707_05160 [Candidatus Babeliaceae bacterium]|jgi:hypothetical protein
MRLKKVSFLLFSILPLAHFSYSAKEPLPIKTQETLMFEQEEHRYMKLSIDAANILEELEKNKGLSEQQIGRFKALIELQYSSLLSSHQTAIKEQIDTSIRFCNNEVSKSYMNSIASLGIYGISLGVNKKLLSVHSYDVFKQIEAHEKSVAAARDIKKYQSYRNTLARIFGTFLTLK